MYTLKAGQPAFVVVDGPNKGRVFKPGEIYAEVPQAEAGRFEAVHSTPEPMYEERELSEEVSAADIFELPESEQE